MGLNLNILSLPEHVDIISDMSRTQMLGLECHSWFIRVSGSTIVLSLGVIFEKISIELKKCSNTAHVAKRAYNGSAGYDVWSA